MVDPVVIDVGSEPLTPGTARLLLNAALLKVAPAANSTRAFLMTTEMKERWVKTGLVSLEMLGGGVTSGLEMLGGVPIISEFENVASFSPNEVHLVVNARTDQVGMGEK